MSRTSDRTGLVTGLVAAAVAGVAAAFVVDPSIARRRLALIRDKVTMVRTRVPRQIRRAGRAASAEAYGIRQKVVHVRPQPSLVETAPFEEPETR